MSIETPAESWGSTRVYGTWRSPTGDMLAGSYKIAIPIRVTNAPDDVIIPAGVFAQGQLNTTEGTPSLDMMVPASDDPDNFPTAFEMAITISFVGSKVQEIYSIPTPEGEEVDLRTVVLVESLPAPTPYLVRGVPGGLAVLDADGDVLNAAGEKVTGGTGGGGIDEAALETYLETHLDDVAFDGDYAKLSNRPTIPSIPATLPPTDGTVTNAKVAAGAGITLDKTADYTTAPGRLAMTNAQSAKLAGIPADAQSAAQVSATVAALINSAPGALDTLAELAAAMGNDANFATTMTNALALKANDNAVIKTTGAQSKSGILTFTTDPVFNDAAIPAAKVVSLVTALSQLATIYNALGHLVYVEDYTTLSQARPTWGGRVWWQGTPFGDTPPTNMADTDIWTQP